MQGISVKVTVSAGTECETERQGKACACFCNWLRKTRLYATSPSWSFQSVSLSHNSTYLYAHVDAQNPAFSPTFPNFVPPLQVPYYLVSIWTIFYFYNHLFIYSFFEREREKRTVGRKKKFYLLLHPPVCCVCPEPGSNLQP